MKELVGIPDQPCADGSLPVLTEAQIHLAHHTPGPWGLCLHLSDPSTDASCGCGYRGGIWGPDGEHTICEMGSTIVKGEEGLCPPRYPRPTELANARLIAAAPELLAAVSLMLEYDGHDVFENSEWGAVRAAFDRATSDHQPRAPEEAGEGAREAKQPPPTNSTEALEACGVVLGALKDMHRTGESHEMAARWVCERLSRAGLLAQPEALASTLREENARLREGLEKAARRFREYEASHQAKVDEGRSAYGHAPAGAVDKVKRNREMAEICEALTTPSKDQDQ